MENFATGAIKDLPDTRDYHFSAIAGSLPPFDWSTEYDVEKIIGKKLKVKDQDGSSSCGGQAWGYYGEVLDSDYEEKSAKFIYAQTFEPGGGTYGRRICDLVVNKGWGDERLTPSYDGWKPAEEAFYTRPQDITPEAFTDAYLDRALSYATVSININSIAQAIRENKGCVIGITGKNNNTWRTAFPLRPDVLDNTTWNHWVFCTGAKLIDGKKFIKIINSWGDIGEEGHQYISEDYFQYPYVWSAWTMVYNFPKPQKYIFNLTLKLGSRGDEVRELQRRLNLKPDGIFGLKTHLAVKEYQKKHNLFVDGIVGAKTRAELNQ